MYANAYQSQAVTTASPAQLVLMLYDGILASITRAQAGEELGDVELVNRELVRAQDIVNELRMTLDFERGGQIAANLGSLYTFCTDQLIDANVRKDTSRLEGVRGVVANLRETWQEACCQAPVGV
jgi:flagellar secretion chaperone FliS